ncbi:hypothetical protein BLOT_002146 [Blomia tropicalis]|nr:hypothetical protein BLOT_002146 [Blomia tropicalis]
MYIRLINRLIIQKLKQINYNHGKQILQCRSISLTKINQIKSFNSKNKQVIDQSKWNTIYRFPLIVPARLFSRCKLYLTSISVISLPVIFKFYLDGLVATSDFFTVIGCNFFSLILLYGFGHLFRRLIGSIYLSKDGKSVRISHLTFFGNRQETIVDLNEITPLTDSNININDLFLKVTSDELKSIERPLYMSLRFGGIIDRQGFAKIFGVD